MKSILIKIKNRLYRYRIQLFFIFAALFGVFFWIAMPYMTPTDKGVSETNYELKQGDYLFSLKEDSLATVSDIIVVGAGSSKNVVVKDKATGQIVIYQNVSGDAFDSYNTLVLKPFLEKNPKVNYRYMNDFVGLKQRLGVANDPNELISNARVSEMMGVLIALVSQIILFGGLIYLLIYFQSNMIANKVKKIVPKDIKDSLDDLIGMEDIKEELLQLEDMVLNRKLYKQFNINKNFNVMLTGMAGTGKTKIGRCLAKRLDVPMYYESAASLQSGFVGGGSKALKKLVAQASKHDRCIIFLDEAESLLQSRVDGAQHWEKETINTLLSLLDGVNSSDKEIIWMVASNMDEYKINMDDAMLRRFQLKINFRLPNFDERKKILESLILKMDKGSYIEGLDLSHVAGLTSGMSPALLENLIGRASLMAIQEKSKVTQDILLRAFERVSVGLTDRETTANMEEKRKLVAIHESGHFILKLHQHLMRHRGDLTGVKDTIDVIKISTESVSKMGALGFVLSKQEELMLQTRDFYENELMQLYAGMANEEIFYGHAGVTTGAQNDIEKATQLLKLMIGQIGFYQDHKLNYTVINKDGAMSDEQYQMMKTMSAKLFTMTRSVLLNYQNLTTLLSDKLLAEYTLSIDEALTLVGTYFNEQPDLLTKYACGEYQPIDLKAAI